MSYRSKSDDSFKTRLRFYLYDLVVNKVGEKPSWETLRTFDPDNHQDDVVNEYTTVYYQQEGEYLIREGISIDDVYTSVKELGRQVEPSLLEWKQLYFEEVFQGKLTEKKFDELKNANECFYCELTLSDFEELAEQRKIHKKNDRGWTMEIDRKFPNMEYSNKNCVPSCYWCNNAKTDEFNAEEFKEIGELMGAKLLDRLNKKPQDFTP